MGIDLLIDFVRAFSPEYARELVTILKSILVVLFIFAIIECFFGFKLLKLWVAIYGFFFFGSLGVVAGIILMLSSPYGSDIIPLISLGIPPISAVLGAYIAYKLYLFGVFLLVSMKVFLPAMFLALTFTQEFYGSIAIALAVSLTAGLIAVNFVKPIIILATSIFGGLAAGSYLETILDLGGYATAIILGLVFVILGICYQFQSNAKPTTPNPTPP